MKSNENLALFIIGIVTIAITFLGLIAFDKASKPSQEASRPSAASDEQSRMLESLIKEIESLKKTEGSPQDSSSPEINALLSEAAGYLATGSYDEPRHIGLEQKLRYFEGMTLVPAPQRETISKTIKELQRLADISSTMNQQLQLAGDIDEATQKAYEFLTGNRTDLTRGAEILAGLNRLYSVRGLSRQQNQKLSKAIEYLNAALELARKKSSQQVSSQAPQPIAPQAPAPKASAPQVSAAADDSPAQRMEKASPAKAPAATPSAPKPSRVELPVVTTAPQTPQPVEDDIVAEALKSHDRIKNEALSRDLNDAVRMASEYLSQGQYIVSKHIQIMDYLDSILGESHYLREDQMETLLNYIEKMNLFAMSQEGGM